MSLVTRRPKLFPAAKKLLESFALAVVRAKARLIRPGDAATIATEQRL